MKHKKYFFEFIVFLFFMIIFDRGIFHIIRLLEVHYYKKIEFNRIFYQKRDFNKQFLNIPKGTYNTLIIGSSRTHRGIHPYYLFQKLGQKAFKIAKARIHLKFNYYFYKKFKHFAGIPRVVIYGLDYFMFAMRSHPFFLSAVSGENILSEGYSRGPLLLLSNKQRIDAFFSTLLDQWNETFKTKPTTIRTRKIIDPFIGYKKVAPLDTWKPSRFIKFGYEPFPGKEGLYFRRLLNEWQRDKVQVILVFIPDFVGTYASNYQMDLFKKEIQDLTASYENVFIYDYNRPDRFSLSDPSFFLDGGYGMTNSHLSRKGALRFNRLLYQDIEKHYRMKK